MTSVKTGLRTSGAVIAANIALTAVKITTGVVGNSYALVADGIESAADTFTSAIVWIGLRISVRPPDHSHPYGHGKAESIAAVVVALTVLGAAALIAFQAIQEITTPHQVPASYTLFVLIGVIVVKELMYRRLLHVGKKIGSTALSNDAWHQRSDAITSLAAFIGISVALIGGEDYARADDWAALAACVVIAFNGGRLLSVAINEIMDAAAPENTQTDIRRIAKETDGVVDVEKCRVRKSGLGILMDIHVVVDGYITVRRGHDIAHEVQRRLYNDMPEVRDVVVHIEPHDL